MGPRIDEGKIKRKSLFAESRTFLAESVLVQTDESSRYPKEI